MNYEGILQSQAVASGDLNADEAQARELTQGITFYLSGSLNAFQSDLIAGKYLNETSLTLFRHLQRLLEQYGWSVPITLKQFERVGMKVHLFLKAEELGGNCCERCLAQQQEESTYVNYKK